MKKSKLDRPHIKLWIAHELADGRSQRQIAEALDTSQPTISRIARRDDVRELIQEEEKKFLQQTKDILEKIKNDPGFLAEFQKAVEKKLLNFKGLLSGYVSTQIKLRLNSLYQSFLTLHKHTYESYTHSLLFVLFVPSYLPVSGKLTIPTSPHMLLEK